MIYEVEAAILGGGPAGAACAIALQRKQISNLILDKCVFPRPKTCGGLMTDKTVSLLRERVLPELTEAEFPFCDVSHQIELWYREERLTRSLLERPLRSVRRLAYDDFLIRQYLARGGTLLEGQTGYTLDLAGRCILLKNGDEIRYRRLVGADGALSKTRTALGAKTPTLGFCVETYVPKARLPLKDTVRIGFGIVPVGYDWVIPSGEELCVGLGGLYDRKTDYPALLREHLALLGLDAEGAEIKGAFVPIGKPVGQSKTPADALLIGDAGGFVDPLYGEGLYYSLASGLAAADAIAAGKSVKKRFLELTAPLHKQISQCVRVQKLFFRSGALQVFRRKMKGRNDFAAFYCDHQLARYDYEYSELWKLLRDYKER